MKGAKDGGFYFGSLSEFYRRFPVPAKKDSSFLGCSMEQVLDRQYSFPDAVHEIEKMPGWGGGVAVASWCREWRYDDGDNLSIDRLLYGQAPISKRVRRAGVGGLGVRRVVVNVSEGCHVHASDMLYKVYAAGRLVDYIENAGGRCEVVAVCWGKGSFKYGKDRDYFCEIAIKKASDPLCLGTLAAAITPWALRAWHVGAMDTIGNPTEGHGSAQKIKNIQEYSDALIIDCGDCLGLRAAQEFVSGVASKVLKNAA